MKKIRNNWLAKPDITIQWMAGIGAFCFMLFVWVQNVSLGDYLDQKITQPVDYKVRGYLGKNATFSERLKVIALDDTTFYSLDNWVLSVYTWANILKKIDEKNPKAIFIDMSWSKIVDPENRKLEAFEILKNIKSPIILGASIRAPFKLYEPIDLTQKDFKLSRRFKNIDDLPEFKNINNMLVMGPHKEITSVIDHVGHFIYTGDGRVTPFYQFDFDTIVPHVFTFVDENWKFDLKALWINEQKVDFDEDGLLPVNFMEPLDVYKNAISLRYYLKKIENGEGDKKINEGDVVVIIPQFYTGNTDFKSTPFGDIPAGIIPTSLINSVLTKEWIKPVNYSTLILFFMICLGILVATKTGPVTYWIASGAILVSWITFSTLIFAYSRYQINWVIPTFGFFLSGISVYIKKIRSNEIKTRAIKQALQGNISEEDLKDILKKPSVINLEPRERIVTLMFIDIVGFSLLSENMVPRAVFNSLKETINNLTKIIHANKGVVDKTLGDGLLCYFGYSFECESTYSRHAEYAIKAAMEIQHYSIKKTILANNSGEPVMPFRIGVNTASCFIGDLGYEGKIEFTVIGNGVNFAKRLEGACKKHCIMMSKTTKDLINDLGFGDNRIHQKHIRIKHHENTVEAYELDPAEGEHYIDNLAIELQEHINSDERSEVRLDISEALEIRFSSEDGGGFLINYSKAGFSLRSDVKFDKGKKISFKLLSPLWNEEIYQKLGLKTFVGEVKWVFEQDQNFVHGVSITNISQEELNFFFEYVNRFIAKKQLEIVKDVI